MFGGYVHLVRMSERREQEILDDMAHIDGIVDYWELQKLAGYQLYAQTNDVKYLGMAELAKTMLYMMSEIIKQEPEEEPTSNGYKTTI